MPAVPSPTQGATGSPPASLAVASVLLATVVFTGCTSAALSEARLEDEAKAACPANDTSCVEMYVFHARTEGSAALCVKGDAWWFERPRGDVGDLCSDHFTPIRAVVAGRNAAPSGTGGGR